MTTTDDHDQDGAPPLDPETERCHRYEITAAMNAVIRTCRDIVNDHSYGGAWVLTGDNPGTLALVVQARATVIKDLHMVLKCAETVLRDIEYAHRNRRHYE